MTESAFMIVPIELPEATAPTPGGFGRRAAAPADAPVPRATLEARIRARLDAGEVEFMAGVDAWTVRLPGTHSAASLRARLAGLPVEVADDQPFFAI